MQDENKAKNAKAAVDTAALCDNDYLKMPAGSARQYIDWLYGQATAQKTAPREKDAPFLSVVTRTVGSRISALADVLLCLYGQTDDDFELLICAHKVDDEKKAKIMALVHDMPDDFQKKVRYIPVSEDGRSAPLNAGFMAARGEYTVSLDDDDLVTSNWVAAFRSAAEKSSGRILHSYCIRQNWTEGQNGTGLAATGRLEPAYCEPFDYILQTADNACPLMTLAFPTAIYQNIEKKFDVNMNTSEDRDYLMHIVFITGVEDIHESTAIYRWWQTGDTSASLHNQEEWAKNYQLVQERMSEIPILLPKGSSVLLEKYYRRSQDLDRILEKLNQTKAEKEILESHHTRLQEHYTWVTEHNALLENDIKELREYNSFLLEWTFFSQASDIEAEDNENSPAVLYLSRGEDFGEEGSITSENLAELPLCEYSFNIPNGVGICQLRFDPTEYGGQIFRDFDIAVTGTDGQVLNILPENWKTNGYFQNKQLGFFVDDPQIIFDIPKKFVPALVTVKCKKAEGASQDFMNNMVKHVGALALIGLPDPKDSKRRVFRRAGK